MVSNEAHEWDQQFSECSKLGMRGFSEKHITPYMHVAKTHAAHMVAELGGLSRFSGEALEHSNDEFKKNHMRQTNCKDICESLRVQKRRELARRNKEIQAMNRNTNKPVRHSCQVLRMSSSNRLRQL